MKETMMKTAEASKILGMSVSFLNQDRSQKQGRVPFVKLGRSVRYRRSDLERCLARNLMNCEPA